MRSRGRAWSGQGRAGAFRVATFSEFDDHCQSERAKGHLRGRLSRALTSRVAPSISRNPPCRFYRLEIYYFAGPLSRPLRLPRARDRRAGVPRRCAARFVPHRRVYARTHTHTALTPFIPRASRADPLDRSGYPR